MEWENGLRLETKRLWLTPLTLAELIRIDSGAADMPVEPEALTDEVRLAIRKKIARMRGVGADQHEWLTYWLIVLRENRQGIGFAGFKGIGGDGFAEMGYGVSLIHRRKGYMTEALAALIQWAKESGARGVVARVDPANTGSVMTLQRCGFDKRGSSAGQDEYRIQF